MSLVQIPLRAGIEEGADPKQTPVGKLSLLENGVWKKDNLIEKRDGTISKTKNRIDGDSIYVGKRLATRGDELCLTDGSNLFALSSLGLGWKHVGRIPSVSATWTPLLDSTAGVSASSIDINGNYLAHAWITGDPTVDTTGTLFVEIVDKVTRTVFLRATKLGTTYGKPTILITGGKAIVVARSGANIVGFSINLTTFAVAAGVNLRTDADAVDGCVDACLLPATSNVCILYGANAATTKIVSFNSLLALQLGPVNVDATATAEKCAIAVSSTGTIYCVIETTQVKLAVHTAGALAQAVAPVGISGGGLTFRNIGVGVYDGTSCIVAYTDQTNQRVITYKVSSAGVVDADSERGTHSAHLASHPFVLDGRCYMLIADYDYSAVGAVFTGITTAIVEVEVSSKAPTGSYVPHRYVAKVDHLVGAALFVPTRALVSGTRVFLEAPTLSEVPTLTRKLRAGLRLLEVGANSDVVDAMWGSVTFGLETYISCGGLFAYDGQSIFDYGFSRIPVLSGSSSSTPAGGIVLGTYVYATYREFRSAAGVLHRGPPISWTVTYTGTPSQGTFSLVNVNVDAKHSLDTGFGANPPMGIRLPIFRSIVGSTKPRRMTMDPSTNVVTVDLLTRTHQFVDTRPDANIDGANASLATRPLLYTEGGILPDEQPPAFVLLHQHQDRLWGVDGSRQQIWFSKSFNDDRGVAPGFSTSFRVLFGKNVYALATLEDKLVTFGEDWISLILGEGPAPNGLNASLSSPQPLQTDVGCTNPRSVVSMPDGVMFLTQSGKLFLLTRQLELVWIGKPVQDRLAAFPNVVAAVLVPSKNQVRFCCNNSNSTTGIVLVFDYVMREWSVFKYSDLGGTTPFADAIIHQGVFTFVTPGGKVYVESASYCLDDAENDPQWVTMGFELAWLSAAGPVGWQHVRRVQLLGDRETHHDLTIALGFNHRDAYDQSYTFTAEQVATHNDCPTMRVGTKNGASPRCKALRVRVTDVTPTTPVTYPVGTGKGGLFSAIALEIEPLPGPARHGARRSKV